MRKRRKRQLEDARRQVLAVEEAKIDWDEVEAAVDRWESKPPLILHD